MQKNDNQSGYKLAVVSGGLAGCAVAVRTELVGMANDNIMNNIKSMAQMAVNKVKEEKDSLFGLKLHTAVLLDTRLGRTVVKVTYPQTA